MKIGAEAFAGSIRSRHYYGKEHFECRNLSSSVYIATLRAITIW